MKRKQPKRIKINTGLLQDSMGMDVESYNLPRTLAGVPKEQQIVLDNCFTPVRSMLEHGLSGIMAEGIPQFFGYGALTGLAQNGLIRAGVEVRADDMTAKWGEFTADGEDKGEIIKNFEAEIKRYNIKKIFNKAAAYCGYYGGCLVYIDTGSDDLANPLVLTPETFRMNSLRGLKIVEPYVVTPAYYNSVDPLADDYYKPSVWYVQGVLVHTSRFLYFTENELPTLIRPAYNFFGLPLAQKVYDAVAHFTGSRECAGRLLEKYSLTIFKTNMDNVLSGGFDDELQNRVKYFANMRDNDGVATIDKEQEDIVVQTTSLAGVTDVVRQAQEYVAAMFNTPVTKMWGLSPSGFNTGDSDLRQWYDNIASLQSKMFTEPIRKVVRLLQLNKYGVIDESIKFEFAPLAEEDNERIVNINKTKADTNAIYLANGVLREEEVRERLINDPDSGYNGLVAEELPPREDLDLFDENEDESGDVDVSEGDTDEEIK